jgi:hypothetical protein
MPNDVLVCHVLHGGLLTCIVCLMIPTTNRRDIERVVIRMPTENFCIFKTRKFFRSRYRVRTLYNVGLTYDSRFERAAGADTWLGRTHSTALGPPVLLFYPLWQTPFTPETAASRKLFWNCPIGRSILTLLSGVTHNPGFAGIRSSHLYIADTNRPDSQRDAVTSQ